MDDLAGLARLIVAAVFVVAAWAKLSDRGAFHTSVSALGVPEPIAPAVAAGVPFLELAIGASVLVSATARAGAAAACTLLVIFSLGIGVNLARGNRPDCNCFGQLHSAPLGPGALVRNASVAAVAALVVAQGSGRFVSAWIGDGAAVPSVAFGGAICAFALGLFMMQRAAPQRRLIAPVEARERTNVAQDHRDHDAPAAFGLPIGTPAPEFTLASVEGDDVTLAALSQRGLPVMLVFVSSNCVSCHKLLPAVAHWQRVHASRLTLAVIGSGDAGANRLRFTNEGLDHGLLDGDGGVADAYAYEATPCAVMVDTAGSIATPMVTGPDAIRSLVAAVPT